VLSNGISAAATFVFYCVTRARDESLCETRKHLAGTTTIWIGRAIRFTGRSHAGDASAVVFLAVAPAYVIRQTIIIQRTCMFVIFSQNCYRLRSRTVRTSGIRRSRVAFVFRILLHGILFARPGLWIVCFFKKLFFCRCGTRTTTIWIPRAIRLSGPVRMNGQNISPRNSVEYPGVKLDSKLTFNESTTKRPGRVGAALYPVLDHNGPVPTRPREDRHNRNVHKRNRDVRRPGLGSTDF